MGRVSQKRKKEARRRRKREGVCTMQSRASVAKVGRLRWGVSIARAHWCMNAAKSNASLNRQEGAGKVKPCRERAAVHRRQGATVPPSPPPSLYSFLVLFSSPCCCVPLIYLFACFSSSPALRGCLPFCATEEATALTRYSGHKERATEIKRHSYSQNISISPEEYQLNWYQMNPTPPRLHFRSSPPSPHSLLCRPDLSQGVTVSYSLICVNPCFHQHGRRRATSGGPVSPPISATLVHRLRLITRMSEKESGDGK